MPDRNGDCAHDQGTTVRTVGQVEIESCVKCDAETSRRAVGSDPHAD